MNAPFSDFADRVVCSADKVIGNKPANQRYRRLFRKELQGVIHGTEGSERSKYVFIYDELTATKSKAFSARILKQLAVVESIYLLYKTFHLGALK